MADLLIIESHTKSTINGFKAYEFDSIPDSPERKAD